MSTLLMNAGINFAFGMTPGSRVDNFGHLGGFLGGLVISFLVGPRYKTIGYDRSGRYVALENSKHTNRLSRMTQSNDLCSIVFLFLAVIDNSW
mmetsp:Transcript_18909/g.47525  ORF Transcript_18909/g.47525 Transcript_18909/m.47525 type:complete len:93 (+) Transcript_18909:198-476(+)